MHGAAGALNEHVIKSICEKRFGAELRGRGGWRLEGKKSYEQLPCKWLEATITFQISLDEVSRQETGRGLTLDRDSRDKLMLGWSNWSGLLPPFGVAS